MKFLELLQGLYMNLHSDATSECLSQMTAIPKPTKTVNQNNLNQIYMLTEKRS